jgi:hypothetical protein
MSTTPVITIHVWHSADCKYKAGETATLQMLQASALVDQWSAVPPEGQHSKLGSSVA